MFEKGIENPAALNLNPKAYSRNNLLPFQSWPRAAAHPAEELSFAPSLCPCSRERRGVYGLRVEKFRAGGFATMPTATAHSAIEVYQGRVEPEVPKMPT